MSIMGIGVDLVELERMQQTLDKDTGASFKSKVFSADEVSYCEAYAHPAERYGARFAAKEAFIKAYGEGGIPLQEITITHETSGKPRLLLSDGIWQKLKKKQVSHVHVSLSHTKKTATAFVILED